MSCFARVVGIVIVTIAVMSLSPPANAAVTLLSATTQVVVNGGEANNGLVPYNGYFRYTDLSAAEETTWSVDPLLVLKDGSSRVLSNGSIGGLGSPSSAGGGVVRSTATIPDIASVQADTELIGSNARTTFTFTAAAGNQLDGLVFIFYAENDLFSFSNDAAAFTGSIAGGNLTLFMFDSVAGGLSVRLNAKAVANSRLTLFGAGLWTGFGSALERGDLSVLSSDGSNFQTLGDLGLALAFSLNGASATVVVNYDTQPEPPQPLDHFFCYRTKSTKGDLCTAEAPANAGNTCDTEEDCGGFSGDEDTDASSFCVPNTFPKGLRVALEDQLEDARRIFDVKKPINLCAPADKNDEGISDASTHLRGFQLALTKGRCATEAPIHPGLGCTKEADCGGAKTTDFCVPQAKSVKVTNINVTNQFHPSEFPLRVDAIKPDRLLVPAALSSTAPVDLPGANDVDHYKCYRAKVSKGAPKFIPIPAVAITDQFTGGVRVFDLTKPTRVCTPTAADDQGIKDASEGLMCYKGTPVKGVCAAEAPSNSGGGCVREQNCGGTKQTHFCAIQPKFQKAVGLFVNDQFGPGQVDTLKEDEFCVPSEIVQAN